MSDITTTTDSILAKRFKVNDDAYVYQVSSFLAFWFSCHKGVTAFFETKRDGLLQDVTIVVGSKRYFACRIDLYRSSEYFRSLMSDATVSEFDLSIRDQREVLFILAVVTPDYKFDLSQSSDEIAALEYLNMYYGVEQLTNFIENIYISNPSDFIMEKTRLIEVLLQTRQHRRIVPILRSFSMESVEVVTYGRVSFFADMIKLAVKYHNPLLLKESVAFFGVVMTNGSSLKQLTDLKTSMSKFHPLIGNEIFRAMVSIVHMTEEQHVIGTGNSRTVFKFEAAYYHLKNEPVETFKVILEKIASESEQNN